MRTAIAAVLRQFNAPLDTMRWATMSLSPASVADVRACRNSQGFSSVFVGVKHKQHTLHQHRLCHAQVRSDLCLQGPLLQLLEIPATELFNK